MTDPITTPPAGPGPAKRAPRVVGGRTPTMLKMRNDLRAWVDEIAAARGVSRNAALERIIGQAKRRAEKKAELAAVPRYTPTGRPCECQKALHPERPHSPGCPAQKIAGAP